MRGGTVISACLDACLVTNTSLVTSDLHAKVIAAVEIDDEVNLLFADLSA